MQLSPQLLSPISWGKGSVALGAAHPMQQSPPLLSHHGLGSQSKHNSWSGFGYFPMVPYLNPKLHLFVVPEDDVDTAPTAETTKHPPSPATSQEDETTSSSERTSVSAALESLSVPKSGWGSHLLSLLSSKHCVHPGWARSLSLLPSPFYPMHPYWGVCDCSPTTQMTGMSLLAHLHTSCMTPQGGTDTVSSLFPASLLPSSEAPAVCSQGQAKEGKGPLQLKDCCQPC